MRLKRYFSTDDVLVSVVEVMFYENDGYIWPRKSKIFMKSNILYAAC